MSRWQSLHVLLNVPRMPGFPLPAQLGPGDCRHAVATLSRLARHADVLPPGSQLHIMVHEDAPEALARYAVLLAALLDTSLPPRYACSCSARLTTPLLRMRVIFTRAIFAGPVWRLSWSSTTTPWCGTTWPATWTPMLARSRPS